MTTQGSYQPGISDRILAELSGRTLTFDQLRERMGPRYSKVRIRSALTRLVATGRVEIVAGGSRNRYRLPLTPEHPVRPLPEYTHEDGEGPRCPFCGTVWTADDPMYYDESGFEDDCDECGNAIRIEPVVSVSWKTLPIRWAEDPKQN